MGVVVFGSSHVSNRQQDFRLNELVAINLRAGMPSSDYSNWKLLYESWYSTAEEAGPKTGQHNVLSGI
jgi:hypothetical protein